jgi:hypothetical protein
MTHRFTCVWSPYCSASAPRHVEMELVPLALVVLLVPMMRIFLHYNKNRNFEVRSKLIKISFFISFELISVGFCLMKVS